MLTETFRTPIQIAASTRKISHQDIIFCIGSCFAENIGGRLREHKFRIMENPHGILFNPLSIGECLQQILQQREPDLPFYHNGLWQSYQFHGCFSNPDRETCIRGMREAGQKAYSFAQKTDWLILSLGSNVIYRLKENGNVVANCHKMPSGLFDRQALAFQQMQAPLQVALQLFKQLRPNLQCLLTVSPVRYIKNNFEENSYSKANLRILAHRLCESFDWISYFPAFEIMNDDLRDYRFYAKDRIHPSEEAIDYIWDCFSDVFFSDETKQLNSEIAQVRKSLMHNATFPESDAYRQFCETTLQQLNRLQTRCPALDWEEERRLLETVVHNTD